MCLVAQANCTHTHTTIPTNRRQKEICAAQHCWIEQALITCKIQIDTFNSIEWGHKYFNIGQLEVRGQITKTTTTTIITPRRRQKITHRYSPLIRISRKYDRNARSSIRALVAGVSRSGRFSLSLSLVLLIAPSIPFSAPTSLELM